jgi:hypothetical protein
MFRPQTSMARAPEAPMYSVMQQPWMRTLFGGGAIAPQPAVRAQKLQTGGMVGPPAAGAGYTPANAWAGTPGVAGNNMMAAQGLKFDPYRFNAAVPSFNVPFHMPVYSNTMSNTNWSKIAANTRAQSSPNVIASNDAMMSDVTPNTLNTPYTLDPNDEYKYLAQNPVNPLGTAGYSSSVWPSPGTSLFPSSTISGQPGWLPSLAQGIQGAETNFGAAGGAAGARNPAQVGEGSLSKQQITSLTGAGYSFSPKGVPQNPASSQAGENTLLNQYAGRYSTPQQVGLAYNSPGNVNPNYPGSGNPWIVNRPVSSKGNQPPSSYIYGNPASDYSGFLTPTVSSGASTQFQNAIGSQPGTANARWGAPQQQQPQYPGRGYARGGPVKENPTPMRKGYEPERYPDMRPYIPMPYIPDWRDEQNLYDQTPPPPSPPTRQLAQKGGPIGRGSSPSGGAKPDDVPAMLTAGEYVIPRKAAQAIGPGNLQRMSKAGQKSRLADDMTKMMSRGSKRA